MLLVGDTGGVLDTFVDVAPRERLAKSLLPSVVGPADRPELDPLRLAELDLVPIGGGIFWRRSARLGLVPGR